MTIRQECFYTQLVEECKALKDSMPFAKKTDDELVLNDPLFNQLVLEYKEIIDMLLREEIE